MGSTVILGAGLSGISTAYFLQEREKYGDIVLLEKENETGGLCRSIRVGDYLYDIGPHILFSKDKEMLGQMLDVIDEGKNDLVRSNRILYKGRRIQYPFENDLSKLPGEDLDYCIHAFNDNPYGGYEATNMLQFFLKTFGEGITNIYLRPYNEKIWKYDPAFMNTSMVERIPKPADEEIRRSAAGETVPGYLHQLYFSYPKKGGIQAVPDGFKRRLDPDKCTVKTGAEVAAVRKRQTGFEIETASGETFGADVLISTIPVHELVRVYENAGGEIREIAGRLRYNSILIGLVRIPYDLCGDNFAFMIPDRDVIFHRISKMDFLGSEYHRGDAEAAYMVEITYREGDRTDRLGMDGIRDRVASGLCKIGFAHKKEDVEFIDITSYKYAYVIYDLDHARNMTKIRSYFEEQNIVLNGRFGNFEYWNMDRIVRESYELSKKIG